MEKFIKENKNAVIVIIIVLGFLFYWFQLRPISIKKDCSWVTETIPADVGVTKEQADANKKEFAEKCDTTKSYGKMSPEQYLEDYSKTPLGCFRFKKDTLERPPQPEKEVVREATKIEYDKCLRQNGL